MDDIYIIIIYYIFVHGQIYKTAKWVFKKRVGKKGYYFIF